MIRVDDVKSYQKASPTQKLLTLVLAIFGKDKGNELRFDHRLKPRELRLFYWVRDELFEMVPPPTHIWPELFRILLKESKPAAGQKRPKSGGLRAKPTFPDFPYAGTLEVRYGGKPVTFDILFFRGRSGEHIWIEKNTPVDVSAAAADFLSQTHKNRKPSK
jgi:hypothetical protein